MKETGHKIDRKVKKKILVLAGVVILYLAIFGLVEMDVLSRHYKSLLVPVGVNIILAVSLNLTVGFLGELTLGHAGFMAVGAYAGCLFSMSLELPMIIEFPLALLVGGIVAGIFGLIIGIPALRLKGDYLAIVTLAFGEIVRATLNTIDAVGGAGGLKGIDKVTDFTPVFVVGLITIILISNLMNSRTGRAICAIRDNRIAAESIGINIVYHKLLVFVIAAFFAGVAGVIYGHNIGILKPVRFDFNKSIEILVMVVMGGMGSIVGSIISAVVITILPELLRDFADYRMLVYSIVLITMMILNSSPKFKGMMTRIKMKLRIVKRSKGGESNATIRS